ncbi:MAG: hypothetical protein AAF411_29955 [Myxococcota bacterium]
MITHTNIAIAIATVNPVMPSVCPSASGSGRRWRTRQQLKLSLG